MLKIGMLVDNRYKILREIGRGGTSCVYLAENIRLHNRWAIKEVYKKSGPNGSVQSNMLVAESSILTRLKHPGLPSIVDVLNTPQSYLIVMEYIEGVSLDKVLTQRGACSQKDVVKWGRQLCDVLSFLHNQQPSIIYRDMKPANIMLKPDGNIVLIDFGMAREFKKQNNRDTTHLGTHGYAAPEQYKENRQTDARTDIYSLGVTLYNLVTGHDPCLPPYGIKSICTMNPSLSPVLDQIIKKCTQLESASRYQSAKELDVALSQIDNAEKITVDFDENKKKKSNPLIWLLAIIPVLIIAIIAAVATGVQKTTDRYIGLIDGVADMIISNIDNTGLNFEQSVHISESDERQFYVFTPKESGYYNIYSISNAGSPVAWVVDENGEVVGEDNTRGTEDDFYMQCWLDADRTYEIETTLYSLNSDLMSTGSYWIYVEYVE